MNFCKETCMMWLAKITLTLTLITIGYIAYILFWPQNIMWQKEPLALAPKTVKAGEYVTITFDYCKYREAVGNVSIYLVDSQIFSLRTVTSALPVGCRNDLKYPIQIPATVQPGKYYIRETLDFHLNPFRHITYSYNSEEFEVIK